MIHPTGGLGSVCGGKAMALGTLFRWRRQSCGDRVIAGGCRPAGRRRVSFRDIRAAWLAAVCSASLIATDGEAAAQSPSSPAGRSGSTETAAAVSGNPAATTFSTGTGWLGRQLGLRDEWGVTLGGVWLADTNLVAAGGAQPGGWTNNSVRNVLKGNIEAYRSCRKNGLGVSPLFIARKILRKLPQYV